MQTDDRPTLKWNVHEVNSALYESHHALILSFSHAQVASQAANSRNVAYTHERRRMHLKSGRPDKQGSAVRWQTRATRCITANVLLTSNVDAHCNKLETELSWQRFASKVAGFQLPQLHSTYPSCIWRLHLGWPRMSFANIFSTRKLESLAVSVEHRLVTDGQTHDDS